MHLLFRSIMPLALLSAFAAPAAAATIDEAAAEAATQLVKGIKEAHGGQVPQPLALAAFEGDDKGFGAALTRALINDKGLQLVDRDAIKGAAEEAQLGEAALAEALVELAGGLGAKLAINGSITAVGGAFSANVRAVSVETGKVVAAGKGTFSMGGDDGDEVFAEAVSLQSQLRRLSDKVAKQLDGLEGEMRYQRFAVLTFDEVGEGTAEKQLGLLVAAELTTLLARDHNLMMVERGQLAKIIEEASLSQTGLVDEANSVELGKLAGAQALVMGSVSAAGDKFIVDAKIVSSATGTVMVAEQVWLPAADLIALSSDAVVLRTTAGSVYRSLLMPGWGQVYNRQPVKGAVFVVIEAGAALGAIITHLLGREKEDQYSTLPAGRGDQYDTLRQEAEDYYSTRNLLVYGAIATHAINVLDAYISGKTYDSAAPGTAPSSGLVVGPQTVGYGFNW